MYVGKETEYSVDKQWGWDLIYAVDVSIKKGALLSRSENSYPSNSKLDVDRRADGLV